MKKYLFILLVCIAGLFVSCEKQAIPLDSVKFKRADISGAKMLAIASSEAITRAGGDESYDGDEEREQTITNTLYKVSEDGTLVEVKFTVEVKGAGDKVAKLIEANLRISPEYIFSVGKDWLWLANCRYSYPGLDEMPKSRTQDVIEDLVEDFNEAHNRTHGASFLLRKKDGALFEWTVEEGAPYEGAVHSGNGYFPPTYLDGWMEQLGKDLYVQSVLVGVNYEFYRNRLLCLKDKGSTLDVIDVLGNNISLQRGDFVVGDNIIVADLAYEHEGGYSASDGVQVLYAIIPPATTPLPITLPLVGERVDWKYISVGEKLFLVRSYDYATYKRNNEIYNVNISESSVSVGSMICSFTSESEIGSFSKISRTSSISFWHGRYDGSMAITTFDSSSGTVKTRSLPEHYPSGGHDEYYNGIAYPIDGTKGFWICDLGKDAAEYVSLDWSSAAEYSGRIAPNTMTFVRFEYGSSSLKYSASLLDGTVLSFYVPVDGPDKGKVKTTIFSENNAGLVVSTMVRLN